MATAFMTPQPHMITIRAFTADLKPLVALLLAGAVNGDRNQIVAQTFGKPGQGRDRLAAIGRVVVEEHDLLALKATLVLVEQVVDGNAGAVPVVGRVVEGPVEYLSIHGRGAAIAQRVHGNAVFHGARDELIGDPGGQ